MNEVIVRFENGNWILEFDKRKKKYPLKNIALNRAKFEALRLAPSILLIYNETDSLVLKQKI